MEKAIYWDMDGTIADLYNVPNWLDELRAESTHPYDIAKPMWDMEQLVNALNKLRELGWVIGIISWSSMKGSKNYNRAVRYAKRQWCKNCGFLGCVDEFHVVRYGTPKYKVAKIKDSILIDDNREIREAWVSAGGIAYNPQELDVIELIKEFAS